MKKMKLFTYLSLLFMMPVLAFAQAPEQECPNAIPVCQGFYSTTTSYVGFGATQELNATNTGCLGTFENNDVWYRVNVSSSGLLAFTLQASNFVNDYDFGLWNVTGQGCQAIYNGLLPIRCDFAPANPAGNTGCSNTIVGPGWQPALPVLAGETYMLNVSNYSSTNQGPYTLDFGPSTASVYDTIKPKFLSAGTKCQFVNDTLTVVMSEPIACNSIAANGSDFFVTPTLPIVAAFGVACTSPTSTTNVIKIKFANVPAPGNYTLHTQQGTDGNSILDPCGNQENTNTSATPDTINFTMNAGLNPKIVKMDTPACIKGVVILDRRINCATVAADGSDFIITGPSQVSVIKAVVTDCDAANMGDTILIFFNKSIPVAGNYSLSVGIGTDNNGISDTCGLSITDPFPFSVSDHGYINAIATPNIVCEKKYINLDGVVTINPPQGFVGCSASKFLPSGTPIVGQLGAFGTTGSNLYPLPGGNFYSDGRTQMLFTRAELQAAGLQKGSITQMAMNVYTKGSTAPYKGFTVKLGCTSITDLSAGFTSAVPMTIVYYPKSFTTVQGINNIVFDLPYNWDTTYNLLVEICFDNPTGTSLIYDYTSNATSAFTSTAYMNSNGGIGCALTTFNATTSRPCVRFTEMPVIVPALTYQWTPGVFVGDSTAANTTAFIPTSRTFTLQIIDSDYCYRRDTANVILSVRFPVLIPKKDTALCIGDSTLLVASGGVTYNWTPATGLSCSTCPNPIARPTTTTTYTVTIADQYGCSDDLSRKIVIHPLPVVSAGRDTTVIYGTSVQLNANAPGGMYYLWDPIYRLDNPNIPDPLVSPEVTTVYTVRVVDTNRCENKDSVKIKVRTNVPVIIPNAFSPNGDGQNDVFRPRNIIFQKLVEFRVFNRWGQEIFSTTDPNKGWDGTYKGVAQDMATYNYLIRVSYPDGHTETFKGDVILVR